MCQRPIWSMVLAYKNFKELASAAGISYSAAIKRLHRGWSLEDIFYGRRKPQKKEGCRKSRGNGVEVFGESYANIRDAHAKLNISVSLKTVKARLRYGWSTEEALGLVDKVDGRKTRVFNKRGSKIKKSYTVDGVEYESITSLAKAYDLDRGLLYNRISLYEWSPDRAVKESVSNPVVIDGVEYRSALNAWESIGINPLTEFNSRMGRKLPIKVCIGIDPIPPINVYEFRGKVYNSMEELAEEYGLRIGQLQYRLTIMSLEEALDYQPRNGRYTSKSFEDDPELATTRGSLYLAQMLFNGQVLHKVGITVRSVEHRLVSQKYKVVAEYAGTMGDVYSVEQHILTRFEPSKCRADSSFDGRTETLLIDEGGVCELMDYIDSFVTQFSLTRLR